jgi:hypothetical protein
MIQFLKNLFHKSKKYKLLRLTLVAPTWDRQLNTIVEPEINYDVYESLVREHKEVIEPQPGDTPEILASLMSQAACDREFPRVIVYPIDYEMRKKVEDLLKITKKVSTKDASGKTITSINQIYPMYEYYPASIISNEELNSKTLIYKYRRSSNAKII